MKNNPGASLGPGPKAGPDGVKDNYYVKKFKYKLVSKNKNGNYVQKGSKFHNERINAFDLIEKELNDIYKLISNAKNETIKYYKENPKSFTVVKPTDLIMDYLKDIKQLLKGE